MQQLRSSYWRSLRECHNMPQYSIVDRKIKPINDSEIKTDAHYIEKNVVKTKIWQINKDGSSQWQQCKS